MFVCNECHDRYYEGKTHFSGSYGTCEICKIDRTCSDCHCSVKRAVANEITDAEGDEGGPVDSSIVGGLIDEALRKEVAELEMKIAKANAAIVHMTPAKNWYWANGPAVTARSHSSGAEIINALPKDLHEAVRFAHGLKEKGESNG